MDVSKERASSRFISTDININSQRLWQHTQDVNRFKSEKMLAWNRGNGHKAPCLTKNLFIKGKGKKNRYYWYKCLCKYANFLFHLWYDCQHLLCQNDCPPEFDIFHFLTDLFCLPISRSQRLYFIFCESCAPPKFICWNSTHPELQLIVMRPWGWDHDGLLCYDRWAQEELPWLSENVNTNKSIFFIKNNLTGAKLNLNFPAFRTMKIK